MYSSVLPFARCYFKCRSTRKIYIKASYIICDCSEIKKHQFSPYCFRNEECTLFSCLFSALSDPLMCFKRFLSASQDLAYQVNFMCKMTGVQSAWKNQHNDVWQLFFFFFFLLNNISWYIKWVTQSLLKRPKQHIAAYLMFHQAASF